MSTPQHPPNKNPSNTGQRPQQPAALRLAPCRMLCRGCPAAACWASCCCSITAAVLTSLNGTDTPARLAAAFHGHDIAAARWQVAQEGAGRAGKWTTALGGGRSFSCAPVISDSQETCTWTSTEPQTCDMFSGSWLSSSPEVAD